ncbi:MAG: ABC transporter permease, partial [Rhodospirillaceae bacterium]
MTPMPPDAPKNADSPGLPLSAYLIALAGIIRRELLRFFAQKGRFFGALVRPLIWLLVFAAGFRAALGIAIMPPYQTYIPYDVYIIPGLVGMIQLFNGMQNSLSMVYDREMGSMRLLLTSPLPRWWLLICRLLAGVVVSMVQVAAFLAITAAWGITMPWEGYVLVFVALIPTGLMLGALGLLLSSRIKQLENFAGVMNFVVFPLFFCSSALYPLWKMRESSEILYYICLASPFTHAVEALRFALYGQIHWLALGWVSLATAVFLGLALVGYSSE